MVYGGWDESITICRGLRAEGLGWWKLLGSNGVVVAVAAVQTYAAVAAEQPCDAAGPAAAGY